MDKTLTISRASAREYGPNGIYVLGVDQNGNGRTYATRNPDRGRAAENWCEMTGTMFAWLSFSDPDENGQTEVYVRGLD